MHTNNTPEPSEDSVVKKSLIAGPLVRLTDDDVIDLYAEIADGTEWAIGGLKQAIPFAKLIQDALIKKNGGKYRETN